MLKSNIKIIRSFPDPGRNRESAETWYEEHGQSIVLINCDAKSIEYPRHWTPLSLKFVISGQEYYHFRDKSYAVTRDNFLILNEGCLYESSIKTQEQTESFSMNFTGRNIREVYRAISSEHLKMLDNPFELYNSSVFIEKLYTGHKELKDLVHVTRNFVRLRTEENLTTELMYNVLEKMIFLQHETLRGINAIPAKKLSTRRELYKRLHTVRDVIDSCYDKDLTLEYLASVSFLNCYYLIRQFKNVFGITPHQYLLQRRLKESEIMLKYDDRPITEIVSAIGFKDLSSFSKAFKAHTTLSPQLYRKKWLG